jgi:hypothetical protein
MEEMPFTALCLVWTMDKMSAGGFGQQMKTGGFLWTTD